ncbi:MAG: PHP domain-containing protein [Clostridiales bacterium]|jgi:predicted metal-dependent phosphoesterase TrpH|nr:PHP domain-containing protein [Clostridiales bacterium]
MKIDLHLHTSEHSGCASSGEREQIEAAISYGLDALTITDHDVLCDISHIALLNKEYAPFKIFPGIEVRTRKLNEDFVVLGIQDDELQARFWDYEDLHAFVREKNGYIIYCHPYRFKNTVPDAVFTHIPDAVEIHSTNIGACDYERILSLAQTLNIKTVANSDSHHKSTAGIYHNILENDVSTEAELVAELKKGTFTSGADDLRIRRYNAEIGERERYIKRLIEEGKDAAYYSEKTNQWHGFYDRVAMGKSYLL